VAHIIQLIPQIFINYRRANTTGLQRPMFILWAWAGVPLGVYNVVSNFNIALQIQPQILTFLSLVTWLQCYRFETVNERSYQTESAALRTMQTSSIAKATALSTALAIVMGAIEGGLIAILRHFPSKGAMTFMAVASAVLLAVGVLSHYRDIWKHRSVRGISFIFVAIDAAGDIFSLISVFFEPHLDIQGMVIYGTELVLWLGVFACGAWFNLRPWTMARLNRAKMNGDGAKDTAASPSQVRNSDNVG